jgi:hypothetical protein
MDANPSKEEEVTMTTLAADETWKRLGTAAHLLHHAALEVWSRAGDQAPDSPLHSLGLGVYLAEAQLSALLPDDHEVPDLDIDPDALGTLQLLTSAQELTRGLPLHRPDLVGASQLVVDLCDLIREARHLGC